MYKIEKDMDIGSAIWDIREEEIQERIIETRKEFCCSKEEIVLKLMKKFSMFQSKAEECVDKMG